MPHVPPGGDLQHGCRARAVSQHAHSMDSLGRDTICNDHVCIDMHDLDDTCRAMNVAINTALTDARVFERLYV